MHGKKNDIDNIMELITINSLICNILLVIAKKG